MCTVFGKTVGEYEITDHRPFTCELCRHKAPGRIQVTLYGGALMVCEPCFHEIDRKKHQPYSRIIDEFALRACGYHVNRKFARAAADSGQAWQKYG